MLHLRCLTEFWIRLWPLQPLLSCWKQVAPESPCNHKCSWFRYRGIDFFTFFLRFFCDCGAGTSPLCCKISEPDNSNPPNNRKSPNKKLSTNKGRSHGVCGKRKGRSALRTDGTSKELSQTFHTSKEHDKQVGDVSQSIRMDCESVWEFDFRNCKVEFYLLSLCVHFVS